jgi:hypothetical protein
MSWANAPRPSVAEEGFARVSQGNSQRFQFSDRASHSGVTKRNAATGAGQPKMIINYEHYRS